LANFGDAWVPRRAEDSMPLLRETPCERVLTSTAADYKNFHGRN
jgi:hypothetical protein